MSTLIHPSAGTLRAAEAELRSGRLENAERMYGEVLDREPANTVALQQVSLVDPRRLAFVPRVADMARHLGRYEFADLFLDTFPYGAHTTASDALWAGLPVVALSGRSFAARVSGSILHAAGLSELVTTTPAAYETLLMELCADPLRLKSMRRRVEATARTSPLFDTAGFARALENLYLQMWQRYQAALPAGPLRVDANRRAT